MSVQVYADGRAVYDSRLPLDLSQGPSSIPIKEALNKGGTASMTLLPAHPLYDAFVPLKTEIRIYRNGKLRWRGRALIPEDDLYCRRTIPCEGELCFFNDAIQRPYSFSGTASAAFSAVVTGYNAAVEPWKRFTVGVVTVDADVELESNKAEKSYETLRKLVQTYGGYILFDDAEDGSRRINWYASLPYLCSQPIKFGRNLLDYSTESSVEGFITRLIPYGAEDEDGNRLQLNIAGRDYVENEEAVAQCGIIEGTAYYDDIESADLLEVRARLDLLKAASMPRTLRLSALDLSHRDLSLDSFVMGQRIPAESGPHGLSGEYDLAALEEDLLDPSSGSVSLTRSADYYRSGTLTGNLAQAAKDDAEAARLEALAQTLARRDQIKKAMEEAEAKAQELADQAQENAETAAKDYTDSTADKVRVEFQTEATYIKAEVENNAGDISQLKQTASEIEAEVENANGQIADLSLRADEFQVELENAEDERSLLEQKVDSITIKVSNGSTKSTITLWADGAQIASQEITLSGLVSFEALKGSGTTEINGSNIVTGIIDALKVAIRGEFQVLNGENLAGVLGYIEGSTGAEITTGVGLASSDKEIYIAVTTGGAILRAGDTMVYIAKGTGKVRVIGNLEVTGTITQNVS